MYFQDLTNYSYYLGFEISEVKNVGWIDAEHPYQKGSAPEAFVEKLRTLIGGTEMLDVHVNMIRSVHPCNLCGETNVQVNGATRPILLGSSEIWIPSTSGNGYFAAPSMILHYMEVHEYLPPENFIEAVMAMDAKSEFIAQSVYDSIMEKNCR